MVPFLGCFILEPAGRYLLQVNNTALFMGHSANIPQRVYPAGRKRLQNEDTPALLLSRALEAAVG